MIGFAIGCTHDKRPSIGAKGFFLVLLASAAYLAHIPGLRIWFVILILSATAVQWYLYRNATWHLLEVVAGAFVIRALFFPLPPIFSDDIFRYLWDGWLVLEGTNPFIHTPAAWMTTTAIERPPVDFDLLNSENFYSVYPPVSQFLFAGGYALSLVVGSSLGLKLIFASLEFTAVCMLARLVSVRRIMLYAWFPLVVLVTAGQTHTESALVLFLVASVWAVRRNNPYLAHLALTLATWTKLYPVLLFPWLVYRFRWKGAWVSFILTGLLWAPFFHTDAIANLASSLQLYSSYFEFNAGVYYGISFLAEQLGVPDATQVVGWLLLGVFGFVLIRIYRRGLSEWEFERFTLWIFGAFFLCSTTVHPWYFLGLIAMVPFIRQPPLHWMWIAAFSVGTYLWYTHEIYAFFVAIAWVGGGMIYIYRQPHLKDWLLRRRAAWKADQFEQFITQNNPTILDLGCAEGYVGMEVAKRTGARIQLLDVSDLNQTDLSHMIYDGKSLPFDDDTFDITIISYVLHHAEHPEKIIAEALRVTSGQVLILENPVESTAQKCVVECIDRMVNLYRMGGQSSVQGRLAMQSRGEWIALFESQRGRLVEVQDTGSWFAPTTLFRLEPDRKKE